MQGSWSILMMEVSVEKSALVESAAKLVKPGPEAAAAFGSVKDALAAELTAALASRPDFVKLVGADNASMMEANHRQTLLSG